MAGLWFRPVCDDLLVKLAAWRKNYTKGDVFSTRDWLNLDGVTVEMPIKYLHRIPFRAKEVEYLAKITSALAPKKSLTGDIAEVWESMKRRFNNWPLQRRPLLLSTGEWVIPFAWYSADIEEVINVLLEARDGKTETFEDLREKKRDQGKELFEV